MSFWTRFSAPTSYYSISVISSFRWPCLSLSYEVGSENLVQNYSESSIFEPSNSENSASPKWSPWAENSLHCFKNILYLFEQAVPHLDLRKPPLESALPQSIITSTSPVANQPKSSVNASISSPVNRSSGAAMAFAVTTSTTTTTTTTTSVPTSTTTMTTVTTTTSDVFNSNFARQSATSNLLSGFSNRSPAHQISLLGENG